ncbi:hypothetical protein N0V83_006458 [Neocucurbitaria cava]|uniref:Uncharacterized protein n=1 Tax=Neocucurbitaria cava TaxID=798079 RepID=A0A9W9CL95_9PLEO|nr:hypothetical protein N0V83_006458 [Neocucurbitaria cava]
MLVSADRALPAMSDIDKSFAFLQDTIPKWLQDIARIEDKATAMQDQVTKLSASHSPFATRKSDSIESIQPAKLDAILERAAPSHGAQTDPLGTRKRKTLSVLSGRASSPLRYRPKQMVVVSYDGDMQKSFEVLVRAIGTGRNMLRKAKMEARMNELAALAGGASDDEDEVVNEEEEAIVSKITYRPRMSSMRARATSRRGGPLGAGGSITPVALFDTTDKTLEHAQGLCEKAAHLTLRDGDCRKELGGVRTDFNAVLETANTEVAKCKAKKLQGPLGAHLQHNTDASISSMASSHRKHLPPVSTPSFGPPSKGILPDAPLASALTAPKVIEIEVDDDEEDEEEDFVMPPIRLTSRLTARA